ncbi:MAG: IS1634 family transposase [Bacilli bacterium]|nr:IS1634 family transposase [Bacilli bacterium]
MAYFLKVSHLKKGDYLQIYDSFHDKEKKHSVHKSYKALGYLDDLIASGIDDPISFYKAEVDKMNKKVKKEKEELSIKKIGESPVKNLGYFLIKGLFNKLGVKFHLDLLDKIENENLSTYNYLLNMVSARIINPCSKIKTFEEVLPTLFEQYNISKDQIYDKLGFVGDNYSRILEVFNEFYNKKYTRKTSNVYFDCTNYYFEIDAEDNLRKKGPSKENRKDPIVGMGLLLDEDQIPLTMKLYPGNQSEKPIIRQCINEMKDKYHMNGKTIQVADKGLNCAKNIFEALKNGDGYIYSQSVKKLEAKEQSWVLLDNDYVEVKDDLGNVEFKYKKCIDDFTYKLDNSTFTVKQIRVASFNPSLAKKQKAEILKQVDKIQSLSSSQAKRKEYGDASKYVTFTPIDSNGEVDDETIVVASLNNEKIEKDLALCGYNLIISSELKMKPLDIYNVYHRLWRIEETFRLLKSELDSRPVYCRKQNSIYGHFLICYLSVFLIRILQIKKFKDEINANQIIDFIRSFTVLKEKDRIINLSSKDKILPLANDLNLNIDNYFFKPKDVEKLLNLKV